MLPNWKKTIGLIGDAMNRNNGVFPRNDAFTEPVEESKE